MNIFENLSSEPLSTNTIDNTQAKPSNIGYLSELQYDIKNGGSIDDIIKAYPELNGNTKMLQELMIDINNGADLQSIEKAYPELSQPVQPQQENNSSLFDKVRYEPYTVENINKTDNSKSTLANIATAEAKYGANIVGGLYNIIPGVAEVGYNVVKGTAVDMGKHLGNLFGLVSDEELNKYSKARNEKTGNLINGLAEHYSNTYGSIEGFNKALTEDPIGIVSDVLTVFGVGAAGKVKINVAQKTALESEKANIINQVKKAGTLEQKSALIKQGIQKSKDIIKKSNQIKQATAVSKASFKYDPYIAVPTASVKGIIKGAKVAKKIKNTRDINKAVKQIDKGEDILFEAVNPTTRENKAVLKQRVKDLDPYISNNPLENSLDKVSARIKSAKEDALFKMKEYESNIGVKGVLETDLIKKKLQNKYQEKIGNSFINVDEARMAQDLIDTLDGFGKQIKDSDIIKIRRAWDKIEGKNKGFMQSAESNSKGEIFGDANKFFREEIRKSNPEYAKYLKKYSTTKTIGDVIQATIERRVGQTKGGFIKRSAQNIARVAGVGAGGVGGLLATEALLQGTDMLASSAFKLTRGKKLLNKGTKTLQKKGKQNLISKQKKNGMDTTSDIRINNSMDTRGLIKKPSKKPKILSKKPLIKKEVKKPVKKEQLIKKTSKFGDNSKAGMINPSLILKDIAKLPKATLMQTDRIAKNIVKNLGIAKIHTKEALKIVKDYIKKYGTELKNKLGELADKIADKTGARLKFIDDSGKSLDDFGKTAPVDYGNKAISYKSPKGNIIYSTGKDFNNILFEGKGTVRKETIKINDLPSTTNNKNLKDIEKGNVKGKFPAPIIIRNGKDFKIIDGHHRIAFFRKEGYTEVPVEIIDSPSSTLIKEAKK